MRAHILIVDEVFSNQYVYHAERQRGIGARAQRDVLMTFFRSERFIRIDRDQLGASPLGFLRACLEMQTRGDRIRSPDQDYFALFVKLRMHA